LKFSYDWLRELVPGLGAEPVELERLITLKTAECEGIEQAGSDWIIEIDNKSLTHRPDLWGHYGMAREVAAITGNSLLDPVKAELLPAGEAPVRVEIADPARCFRYSALFFENVKAGPSPEWLRTRLESIGANSINSVVDVTNYIMAELPQPTHAFDADKLAGDIIIVRTARAGESLAALNGETYELSETDLVIADASGPIALAGVIGGVASAISEETTRVVFESANFEASSVRFTSSRYRLRTDASMRFEKALDPENTVRGLARAIELLRQVCPGIRVVGGVADKWIPRPSVEPIHLPISFVVRKLGKDVSQAEVTRILSALGFGVSETRSAELTVTVPTWRATKDISLKDDLAEEIGRMVGYDSIAPAAPRVASVTPPDNPLRLYLRQLRAQLTAQGFTEVYNYSFTNETDARRFGLDLGEHLAVRNPIASELTHLRRSLVPGLFRNIVTNVRYFPDFRLFEVGNEIHPKAGGEPLEIMHVAGVLYSAHGDEQDFFEMKRVVECLFPSARLLAAEARMYEHPARAAEIRWRDAAIGRLFELHPSVLQAEGLEGRALVFDVDAIAAEGTAAASAIRYKPLRKFPTSGFDLSVVCDLHTPADSICDALRQLAGSGLAGIEFVRQYTGAPFGPNQKSVSYRLEVGALDHTLTAEEVTAARSRVIEGMQALGFELRV
jgi:phenylalanyl-tRNA synthetase beta chain